ncbi:hypothetical protein Tco_1162032, partial [Tanacetum coccineum]
RTSNVPVLIHVTLCLLKLTLHHGNMYAIYSVGCPINWVLNDLELSDSVTGCEVGIMQAIRATNIQLQGLPKISVHSINHYLMQRTMGHVKMLLEGFGLTKDSTWLNKSFQLLNMSLNFKVLGDATIMMCDEHLEEIHVTWAQLEKKWTRLRLYTNYLEEKHTMRGDGVANYKRWRHEILDGVRT